MAASAAGGAYAEHARVCSKSLPAQYLNNYNHCATQLSSAALEEDDDEDEEDEEDDDAMEEGEEDETGSEEDEEDEEDAAHLMRCAGD